MRAAAAAALGAMIAGASAPARADGHAGEVAIVDGVGDLSIVGGIWGQSMPVTYGGLGLFVLGGPAVHGLHHDWTTAAEDLGVRVAAPLAGGTLALLVCKPGSGAFGALHCIGQGGVGIALGMIAAEAVDWFVLSRTDPAPTGAQPLMLSFGGHF